MDPVGQLDMLTDVSWKDVALFTIVKVLEPNLKAFEHAQSIFKWPTGSVYEGSTIN